jgi:hypothetical protein
MERPNPVVKEMAPVFGPQREQVRCATFSEKEPCRDEGDQGQQRLRVEQPASVAGVGKYLPSRQFNLERDAFVIPLAAGQT